jgi:hypothetical protein
LVGFYDLASSFGLAALKMAVYLLKNRNYYSILSLEPIVIEQLPFFLLHCYYSIVQSQKDYNIDNLK